MAAGRGPLNYHLLSDFRVAHQAEVDELLTQSIALLLAEELVTLERVAQDGVRVLEQRRVRFGGG